MQLKRCWFDFTPSSAEAVDAALGVESVHVPTRGSSPAIQVSEAVRGANLHDMVVQNIDMIEDNGNSGSGNPSPERNPQLPDVPTFKEQGYDVVIESGLACRTEFVGRGGATV
jgi:tripartite-type tricarboxylate transporter receptor subunit TctC